MPVLEVRDLCVRVGTFELHDVSLELEEGEVLVLLGPSGAGKTVLLDTVAGFHRPRAGRVHVSGTDVTLLPPEQRRLGVVFQEYALFPHMSVLENVSFGPRARGSRDASRNRKALERLGIAHLADRRPGSLSGGERQRVALARALVTEPRALLLDEPLSALDAPTRDELREELAAFLEDSGTATLYVTHDRAEAFVLADRVGLLFDGRLRQVGEVAEVLQEPRDVEVAAFLGMEVMGIANVVPPHRAELGGLELVVEDARGITGPAALCYRAEDVVILGEGREAPNVFGGRVERVIHSIPLSRVEARTREGLAIFASAFARDVLERDLRAGVEVVFHVPPASLRVARLTPEVADG